MVTWISCDVMCFIGLFVRGYPKVTNLDYLYEVIVRHITWIFLFLRGLHSLLECHSLSGSQVEFDVLNVDTFHSFLEILLEFRGSFISDGDFLSKFLISTLGSQKEHRNRKDEKELTLR